MTLIIMMKYDLKAIKNKKASRIITGRFVFQVH